MRREFQCPSCGAANVVTNPGILMKVCDYCKTAIYWDKESALRAGRKSMDLPPSDRFRVGGGGKLGSRTFTVLGRLVYSYESGTWNEWFIEMSNGEIKWLSEDEGELFLETPLSLTTPVPRHEELEPGMQISLNENVGVVEEIGSARCIGGEGQIPFEVEIGEIYPYVDGSALDGSFSFGLEYDAGTGQPTAFIGKILTPKEARSKPEDREAPVGKTGLAIRCPSCGKPYEGPKLESTEMVVCSACGAGLELDKAEAKVVGKNIGTEPRFTFKIGTPLTVEGVRYEVMGRLLYDEVEEGETYVSMEYVLYNPDLGYLWLSEEDGHFTISRPSHVRFTLPPIPVAKMRIRVGQETFQFYEGGVVTLRWVDGALPWRAAVGEQTKYSYLIKPPQYVEREKTGQEVELFLGRYVGPEEMEKAIPAGIKLPSPRGVYSCQPYTASPWIRGLGRIGIVFLALNVLLFIFSFIVEKKAVVLSEQIAAEQYTREHLTAPFTVDKDQTILRVGGSAPLDNSWLALDFAVVNADEQVVSEFFDEASYYSGSDSEGSWTEGSRSFGTYFKVKKPGTYRLLVHASGGSGYGGAGRNEPITITVTAGRTISWYFWIPIIVALLVAGGEKAVKLAFESRRWAPVTADSDED